MLAPLTESERAEIPAHVGHALRAKFATLPIDVATTAQAGLIPLLLDAAALTVVRAMRDVAPEITARAVKARTHRAGTAEPHGRTALTGTLPVLMRQQPGTVPTGLAELRGCMAEGYTCKQVNHVLGRIEEFTGRTVVCVWDYVDDFGFTGESQFYLHTVTGSLFETNAQFWTWLNGDPACPDTPASPGEPSTWFAARPESWTEADLEFHDEGHNYARRTKIRDRGNDNVITGRARARMTRSSSTT